MSEDAESRLRTPDQRQDKSFLWSQRDSEGCWACAFRENARQTSHYHWQWSNSEREEIWTWNGLKSLKWQNFDKGGARGRLREPWRDSKYTIVIIKKSKWEISEAWWSWYLANVCDSNKDSEREVSSSTWLWCVEISVEETRGVLCAEKMKTNECCMYNESLGWRKENLTAKARNPAELAAKTS